MQLRNMSESSSASENAFDQATSLERSPSGRTKRNQTPPGGAAVKRDKAGFRLKRQEVESRSATPADIVVSEPFIRDGKLVRTITDELAQGAEYVIDGPLRRVTPHYFTYMTFCKQRWIGKTLFEVFSNEFRERPQDYYKRAIASGEVTINGQPSNLDTVLKNGDVLRHRSHLHEAPITSRPIGIVYEDDEIMAINKPSGMPVHPTGRYRYNSAIMILKYEFGKTVHPCNRLDRLTSGLTFLAKSGKAAEKMGKQIRGREVFKEYLAEVIGEFPLEEITCEEPLLTIAPKVALNVVHPDGKEAKTTFKRISFNGKTSIVKCKPHTGRTHQIRVHLQYLGHPIANDPIYSNLSVWGPNLGKSGEADFDAVIEKLSAIGRTEIAESYIHPKSEDGLQGEVLLNETCPTCDVQLFSDPGPNDLDLWLHALKYGSLDGTWTYETPVPYWVVNEHMPFMKLALDEARKCEPTQTAFSVGALLVKDGKILETGFSRELPGNTHAEQCALEKYFAKTGGSDVPKGTILYTTMEPCSERLSGNLPCVDRILKTSIKTVLVGVLEPTTFIAENIGRKKLSERGVEYVHIPGLEKECLEAARKGHPASGI